MTGKLLEVKNLTVSTHSGQTILYDVSFDVAPGEMLALIGESGSGKTTLGLSALGHIRDGLAHSGGQVLFDGEDVLGKSENELRRLRGNKIAYIAQSAAASFNPSMQIDEQVVEPCVVHRLLPRGEAQSRATGLYGQLGLPQPDEIGERYPHQVSGGQLQRLMAAMAMCSSPQLIVMDEPTTALDVTTQIGVLEAFKRVIRHHNAAGIYISHDLAVVSQIADRIVVLRDGKVQELGPAGQIVENPQADYTKSLLKAYNGWTPGSVPKPPTSNACERVLQVKDLTAGYGRGKDGNPAVVAVKQANLTVDKGSVLAVIGESGSGKSTLARAVAGLLPATVGRIDLRGNTLHNDVGGRSKDELRRIQMVFQSPDVALNPAQTVEQILGRPLTYFAGLKGTARTARVGELLEMVRLPKSVTHRRPSGLSGGQKQRVNLARALAADPDLILCDEITSALDTVVAASIIDLLRQLRSERGVALVFITHDISTAASFADEIAVMYKGSIVEHGPTDNVLNHPEQPYTKILVDSVPQIAQGWLEQALLRRAGLLAANEVSLLD